MIQTHSGVSNGLCLRAVRSFLRARAAIKFLLRAASTEKIQMANSEHWLRKFPRRNLDLSFVEKKSVAPSNLADNVQPIPAAYSQFYMPCWLCQITSGSLNLPDFHVL